MCLAAACLLAIDTAVILLRLPDEASQGAIYRIIFYHVPAAWTAFVGCFAALVASILYLVKRDLDYDAAAVAVTEAGLAFGAANLVSGMVWGRVIWGIWWTWDARLTSMLVCLLLYAGYLMLRHAIEEPTQRARIAAVFSIFAFADVPPPDAPPPRSVKCCDGSLSPTCVCGGKLRGCCPHHKGVCGCE
jgi:heme exporter protein C